VIDPRSIADSLIAAADTDRGVCAIEHDGRTTRLTYKAVLAESLAIAAGLHARGLKPGDRVALLLPEVNDFVRAFFGISCAGLVPVPLCPPAQAGDVPTFSRQSRDLLAAGRIAALVTSDDVATLIDMDGLWPTPLVVPLETLGSAGSLAAPVPVGPDAIALLQFTSGSTAAPKGVVLTHANLRANIAAIIGPYGLDIVPSDVAVSWLPLYHDMGLIGMLLAALYARIDTVIMSPVLFLKRPTAWLDALSRYRGSVSFAPNFAYELCLRRVKNTQIDGLDLSSWRIAGCGAEPVRPDTLTAFAERFARAGFRLDSFVASYGLAEHSLAVALSRNGLRVDVVDASRLVHDSRAVPVAIADAQTAARQPSVRIVGCGRSFPGHAVSIVDEQGRRLPDRHVGRIIARGPSVMLGYFSDVAATADVLSDGWLETGDLGYMADGELFVCGRTKDVIIRQGRKYHPPDLESAIVDARAIPISGVVVFGVTRLEAADEVIAVLEARASASSDDLIDHVRRRVRETAGLELDRVVVAPPGTIPRTTSGKVRRAETRARFEAGTLTAPNRD
jgi:acyl-CoA synthetase (AMP-forming)/AMP-acid ligase II